jgi:hypothetical protein
MMAGQAGTCWKHLPDEMGALYFRRFVAQFGRRMTRRFLVIFVLALAGLPAAQISLRADTAATALAAAVLENDILYLRASHVGTKLPGEIRSAQSALTDTNKIIGTVLDLRFADGDNSEAAKAAADLFAAKKLPLAVLTDGQTRNAAVQLAELLRNAREGLIFGSATSGTTNLAPVQPDIAVKVSPEDERVFMENPYAAAAANETNSPSATNSLLPFMDNTTEADLVRAKIKDGDEDGNPPPPQKADPSKPYIQDPVLARAVDLIKGLAIVRAPHS